MGSASDPKGFVTGYPAAHPGGAAYPYNAPPPGANAYAYPAAQPHPAPYYASSQAAPPYAYTYPSRNTALIRRLIAVAIAVFLVFGVATLIVWLILRPRVPDFTVTSATASNFNISTLSQQISVDFDLSFSVRNPNEKMMVHYDHLAAGLFYGSDSIADTSLPPMDQAKGESTNVSARMAATDEYVGDEAARRIIDDRNGDGTVGFHVRVYGWVNFRAGAWRTRRHMIRVYCEDINIGFKNSTARVGALVGGPKKCQVNL